MFGEPANSFSKGCCASRIISIKNFPKVIFAFSNTDCKCRVWADFLAALLPHLHGGGGVGGWRKITWPVKWMFWNDNFKAFVHQILVFQSANASSATGEYVPPHHMLGNPSIQFNAGRPGIRDIEAIAAFAKDDFFRFRRQQPAACFAWGFIYIVTLGKLQLRSGMARSLSVLQTLTAHDGTGFPL